jgi:hypothetical protein
MAACGFHSFENSDITFFFHYGGPQRYPITHANPG